MKAYLHQTFTNHWIDWCGSIEWPAGSPDLTLMIYYRDSSRQVA